MCDDMAPVIRENHRRSCVPFVRLRSTQAYPDSDSDSDSVTGTSFCLLFVAVEGALQDVSQHLAPPAAVDPQL
eukprot:364156-Chlamydomonas_euryale.AAC.5